MFHSCVSINDFDFEISGSRGACGSGTPPKFTTLALALAVYVEPTFETLFKSKHNFKFLNYDEGGREGAEEVPYQSLQFDTDITFSLL